MRKKEGCCEMNGKCYGSRACEPAKLCSKEAVDSLQRLRFTLTPSQICFSSLTKLFWLFFQLVRHRCKWVPRDSVLFLDISRNLQEPFRNLYKSSWSDVTIAPRWLLCHLITYPAFNLIRVPPGVLNINEYSSFTHRKEQKEFEHCWNPFPTSASTPAASFQRQRHPFVAARSRLAYESICHLCTGCFFTGPPP